MRPTGGRTVDYFEMPDGSSVSPYTLTGALEAIPGLAQFQIVQTATNMVTIRAVVDQDRRPTIDNQIRDRLRCVLPNVEIEVSLVASIENATSGKFRVVLSQTGKS